MKTLSIQRILATGAIAVLFTLPGSTTAAPNDEGDSSTQVSLSATASRPVANEMVQARVFASAKGASFKVVSEQVKRQLDEAIRIIKANDKVKFQSGGVRTSSNQHSSLGKALEWSMQSDLQLESKSVQDMSELLGKLDMLGIGGVYFYPTPQTRKKVEDEVVKDAIAAFHERAKLIAATFGKKYKVTKLNVINQGNYGPIRGGFAVAEVAPASSMPLQSGESQVTVMVSGEIELDR